MFLSPQALPSTAARRNQRQARQRTQRPSSWTHVPNHDQPTVHVRQRATPHHKPHLLSPAARRGQPPQPTSAAAKHNEGPTGGTVGRQHQNPDANPAQQPQSHANHSSAHPPQPGLTTPETPDRPATSPSPSAEPAQTRAGLTTTRSIALRSDAPTGPDQNRHRATCQVPRRRSLTNQEPLDANAHALKH